MKDGRYVGNNGQYWLELRVDFDRFATISGEVQSTGPEGFYASFRSNEDINERTAPIPITWTTTDGAMAPGTLELGDPLDKGDAQAVLRLDERLSGVECGEVASVAVSHAGDALREVGVEIEIEEGVRWPQPERHAAVWAEVRGSLREAGLAVREVDRENRTVLPAQPDGWAEADIFATLNDVMAKASTRNLGRPGWELHLLMLSRTRRNGLAGLMFDDGDALPRQGAAVFVDTISASQPENLRDRRIVQTAVHELGHALNLTHRFGREVRRSQSTSFMTYDWKYSGGVEAYWEDFRWTFDDDELRFLRHAPRMQVIPGGSPFASARYWDPDFKSMEGSSQPPWCDLRLWLSAPSTGPTFAYGQPIFLEVSLLNAGSEPVDLPRHVLDVKAGQLDLMIRPWTNDRLSAPDRLAASSRVAPILRRCYEAHGRGVVRLSPGDSAHTNINLAYGSAAHDYAEPGAYEVSPVLSFPGIKDGVDNLVVGRPIRIRVARPLDKEEGRDGELLHRADIRASLALGGSKALQEAADELEDMRARRQRRNVGVPDPLLPTLQRAAGIDHGRRGRTREAARLLAQASAPSALRTFDPHTAESTRRLAAHYAVEADPQMDTAAVVVDLWSRADGQTGTSGGRGAGFLAVLKDRADPPPGERRRRSDTRIRGTAVAVLTPATQLPAESLEEGTELGATVTLTGEDGMTQRVAASRIDLVGDDNGLPAIALVQLGSPVPTYGPAVDLDHEPTSSSEAGVGLTALFGAAGSPSATVAMQTDGELADLATAADGALADQPEEPPQTAASETFRYLASQLEDLASWPCWLTNRCEPTWPPPEGEPYDLRIRKSTDTKTSRK